MYNDFAFKSQNPRNLGTPCTSIIATIRCGSLPLRFLWFSYLVLVFAILRWYHQFRWKSILAIAIGLRPDNSIQLGAVHKRRCFKGEGGGWLKLVNMKIILPFCSGLFIAYKNGPISYHFEINKQSSKFEVYWMCQIKG